MSDSTRVQDDARIRYVSVKPDGTSTSTLMRIQRYTAVNTGHPLTDAMLNALGGTGLNGAILLTGGTEIARYEDRPPIERSTFGPRLGFNAEVYVRWRVNAGKRNLWYMAVALEPDETYTARLVKVVPSVGYELLGECANLIPDLHGTSTINAIDALYIEAIQVHLGGFIPLD